MQDGTGELGLNCTFGGVGGKLKADQCNLRYDPKKGKGFVLSREAERIAPTKDFRQVNGVSAKRVLLAIQLNILTLCR